MSIKDILNVLTIAVAAWGAGLSTYMYFRQNRRAKEIVKVSADVWEAKTDRRAEFVYLFRRPDEQ